MHKNKTKNAIEITLKCEGYGDITFELENYYLNFDQVEHLFNSHHCLTYKNANKKNVIVNLNDKQKYELIKGVDEYFVHLSVQKSKSSTFSQAQQLKYQEIVKDLEKDSSPDYQSERKKTTTSKVGNKKTKVTNLSFVWKHRDSIDESFTKVNKPVGGNKIFSLIHDTEYTMRELKLKAIEIFRNSLNENYFNEQLCQVQLGTYYGHSKIFSDADKKSIWDYKDLITDRGDRWTLTLMTTKMDSLIKTNDKNLASSESLLADTVYSKYTGEPVRNYKPHDENEKSKNKSEDKENEAPLHDSSLKIKANALKVRMDHLSNEMQEIEKKNESTVVVTRILP